MPALLHGVQVRVALGEVHDLDIFVTAKKSLYHFRAMLWCPVTHHHCFANMPLDLLEIGDERDGVESVVCPEKLPTAEGKQPVYRDFPVASGVWDAYPLPPWRPIFSAGHSIVYEKCLVLHDHDESFLF